MGILDEEKLVEGAREKGDKLGAMLRELVSQLPGACAEARGEGLLWGLVLRKGLVARDILPKIQERGVLLTASGENILRFSPPLVVSVAELEEGVRAVREVLEVLMAGTSDVTERSGGAGNGGAD
jgi:acetylornithine/succinyldiaminopimelate/putrescine aminotransferase